MNFCYIFSPLSRWEGEWQSGFGSLASSQGQPTTMCLEKENSLAKASLLSACPVLSTHRLRGCWMEQCLVSCLCKRAASAAVISTPFLMGGLPKLLHSHQLLWATWSRAVSVWMLGLCCPPLGQLGLSVGNIRVPSLAVWGAQHWRYLMFLWKGVSGQAYLESAVLRPGLKCCIGTALLLCAPFVPEWLVLVSVLSALFQALRHLLGSPRIAGSCRTSASTLRASTS